MTFNEMVYRQYQAVIPVNRNTPTGFGSTQVFTTDTDEPLYIYCREDLLRLQRVNRNDKVTLSPLKKLF
jgi:hypothetical protein